MLLLFSALCGPSFLFIKIAIVEIPPVTVAFMRVGIGAFLLYLLLKLKKTPLPKLSSSWIHIAIAALFQSAIPFSLFAIGEKGIDSSLASIICGTSPLFTIVLAHFFTENDQFTKMKTVGSALGFFGLCVLIAPTLFFTKTTIFGTFMVLIAAMCYAIGFVYVKKYIEIKKFAPLTLPTIQLFISFLFLLPLALIFENPFVIKDASISAIGAILALSVLGTALAFTVYYQLIALTSATYISTANYIIPIFGAILGVLVLDEKLAWSALFGCVLIIAGVMIANRPIFKS